MWMEVGRVSATTQKFNIRDLQEDHHYLIRIYARNEVGQSEPLESDEPFKVVVCQGKYPHINKPMGGFNLLNSPIGFFSNK